MGFCTLMPSIPALVPTKLGTYNFYSCKQWDSSCLSLPLLLRPRKLLELFCLRRLFFSPPNDSVATWTAPSGFDEKVDKRLQLFQQRWRAGGDPCGFLRSGHVTSTKHTVTNILPELSCWHQNWFCIRKFYSSCQIQPTILLWRWSGFGTYTIP